MGITFKLRWLMLAVAVLYGVATVVVFTLGVRAGNACLIVPNLLAAVVVAMIGPRLIAKYPSTFSDPLYARRARLSYYALSGVPAGMALIHLVAGLLPQALANAGWDMVLMPEIMIAALVILVLVAIALEWVGSPKHERV